MSLLALMADKFELEPAPADLDGGDCSRYHRARSIDADDEVSLLHDNKTSPTNDSSRGNVVEKSHEDNKLDDFEDNNISSSADDVDAQNDTITVNDNSNSQEETKLLITFLLMVIVGTANKIFQKLQAIPMYNYPNSLNLLQNFVYVPLCFAYILPVSRYGLLNNAIPHEVTTMNKKPFIIMGFFDCLTCLLLTFAAVYLPGSLLILLPQAAIPISMILSNRIKGDRYAGYQYVGAVVVVLGILVVLEPLISQRHAPDYTCEVASSNEQDEFCALCMEELTEEGCLSHRSIKHGGERWGSSFGSLVVGDSDGASGVTLRSLTASNSSSAEQDGQGNGELCRWVPSSSTDDDSDSSSSSSSDTTTTLIWSIVTILACIPMTLSSIYKEMSLSGAQTNIDPIFLNGWVAFYQLLFSFPLSVPAGMTSSPPVLPRDLPTNIWNGIKCYLGISTIMTGCHPDDQCHLAPLYVNVFLVFNVCFNILIVYILKYGSANVLFMASTVMVPIGNLAFALPFMPGSTPLKDSDIAGLMVILLGLVTYRFGNAFHCFGVSHWRTIPPLPWRRGKCIRFRRRNLMGDDDQFAWDAPVYDEDENGNDTSNLSEMHMSSTLLEEPLLTPVR